MKATRTDLLRPGEPRSETEKLWIYNGLDCCVTLEVLEELLPQLDNCTSGTYALSRALQAPVLEMNMRGVLIDEAERKRTITSYYSDIERLERQLYSIVRDGIGYSGFEDRGKTKAWRSNPTISTLLYDVLKLPAVRKRNADGAFVRTVDRGALEKLEIHFFAQPVISHILALRDLGKKISVLETEIDSDGRLRTSYNIAGTTTGRFSSSSNDFGTGGNLQNVEERLRRVFIPDHGMKFANIDLEQADSRNLGALCWNVFRDGKYLDACESGDTHTTVAKLTHPDLAWSADLKRNREIADMPYYRHHSLRHVCKVLGHGTNYMGSAFEMARHTKIDQKTIVKFQDVYFKTFEAIPKLHGWVKKQLESEGYLITPLGRKRWFFDRRDDKDTQKKAVAFMGQSMTADEMNNAMLNVWRLNLCQILLQGHDSMLVQYREGEEDEVLPKILSAMRVPIELDGGRQFAVPVDVKVGWNWGNKSVENPLGLSKWPDDRPRRYP